MAKGETLADLARMLRQLKRRDARRRGGSELSYRALAARTGWSAGIIAHYFTGKTLPPTDRFDALVRLLGASPAEQGRLATMRDHVDEDRRQPSSRGMETIRLLGPIEVVGPHGPANLVGSRQRTLIALLGLRVGNPVSHLKLADALWGEELPRTAMRSLYSHVARVRQALDDCGLPGVLVTRDSGYLLDLSATEVRRRAFRRAGGTGQAGAGSRIGHGGCHPSSRRPGPVAGCGAGGRRAVGLGGHRGGAPGPGPAERAGGSVGRPAAPGRARQRRRRDRSACWPPTRPASGWSAC